MAEVNVHAANVRACSAVTVGALWRVGGPDKRVLLEVGATPVYSLRVSLSVVKFWTVLKMAMEATMSCHCGKNPSVCGRAGQTRSKTRQDETCELPSRKGWREAIRVAVRKFDADRELTPYLIT